MQKTISLEAFLNQVKEKGTDVNLGKLLSETFFEQTNVLCQVASKVNDDDAIDTFKTLASQAGWDVSSLSVVSDEHLID